MGNRGSVLPFAYSDTLLDFVGSLKLKPGGGLRDFDFQLDPHSFTTGLSPVVHTFQKAIAVTQGFLKMRRVIEVISDVVGCSTEKILEVAQESSFTIVVSEELILPYFYAYTSRLDRWP